MVWRKKSGTESPSLPGASPRYEDEREKVPSEHVPMVTGRDERVVVPVRLLAELLDMAAQQYGYGQSGVLRIPCDAGHFRQVVSGAVQRTSYAPGIRTEQKNMSRLWRHGAI